MKHGLFALCLFPCVSLVACAAPTEAEDASPTSEEAADLDPPSTVAASPEVIGTDGEALTDAQRSVMCGAAAAVSATLGCLGVTASCGASAVLTVGTTAIPCVLLSSLACVGFAGGSSVIAYYCPQFVNK
jgi:hypothetical protein